VVMGGSAGATEVNVACMDPFNSILERGRKSIRISSLFFSTPLKRIFPDSGVPYPLVSTVGFAIFAICGRSRAAGGGSRSRLDRNSSPLHRQRSSKSLADRQRR
jgi:hypothetical protein